MNTLNRLRTSIFLRRLISLRITVVRGIAAEAGSATAEYAIATLAAVGFAGLLVVILRSNAVREMLTDLIKHALSFSG